MVSRMTNVKLLDAVIEQIKGDIEIGDYTAIVELLAYIPRQHLLAYLPEDEKGICEACNGSGEGMQEDSTCRTCKGSGES